MSQQLISRAKSLGLLLIIIHAAHTTRAVESSGQAGHPPLRNLFSISRPEGIGTALETVRKPLFEGKWIGVSCVLCFGKRPFFFLRVSLWFILRSFFVFFCWRVHPFTSCLVTTEL